MNEKFRIKTLIIILLLALSSCVSYKYVKSQPTFYKFIYSSDFFSLRLNNGTYFGNEDYDLKIEIYLYFTNNNENISIQFELFHRLNQEIDYIVENNYYYRFVEHSIYEQQTKIGMIPLFIKDNLSNYQEITIAQFGNYNLSGIHVDTDKSLSLLGKNYPCRSVLTNEINYTIYYYSDYENLLLYWQIGCKYDITLDKLFDIGKFSGHIRLEQTNIELKTSGNLVIDNLLPIIYAISSVSFFVLLFFFIRRKLKLDDKKKN